MLCPHVAISMPSALTLRLSAADRPILVAGYNSRGPAGVCPSDDGEHGGEGDDLGGAVPAPRIAAPVTSTCTRPEPSLVTVGFAVMSAQSVLIPYVQTA